MISFFLSSLDLRAVTYLERTCKSSSRTRIHSMPTTEGNHHQHKDLLEVIVRGRWLGRGARNVQMERRLADALDFGAMTKEMVSEVCSSIRGQNRLPRAGLPRSTVTFSVVCSDKRSTRLTRSSWHHLCS